LSINVYTKKNDKNMLVFSMIKVAHITTGLETGGAEVQLMRLISALDKDKFEMMVISMDRETYLADRIRELGVTVHSLTLRKQPHALWQGYKKLKEFNPDVIHGTMYQGGVFGTLCSPFLKKRPHVIWTVHEPLEHYDQEPLRKRLQLRLWGLMSGMPECLMYVSHLNKEQHVPYGFNNKKAIVIPNGVDTSRFGPARDKGLAIRKELGIPDDCIVIGKTARYHRQKNHEGFLRSAALLAKKHDNVRFMLVGTNVDENNETLTGLVQSLGLEGKVYMLGNREDIPEIVNAYDVATLTSLGEAFPLTLGEAMVSAVPCVATDVGDNAYIIDDTGYVVPVADDQAMADSWEKIVVLSNEERLELGQRARQRCLDNFTLEQQTKQHDELYTTLCRINDRAADLTGAAS
jgi:glycosyltransferase involved in cell wall biosynthesis